MTFAFLILQAALAALAATRNTPINVTIEDIGDRVQIVGKLHVPLHQLVIAEGVVVEGPFKGYEGGPNLRVQRIDGRATQEDIQIAIQPYFNKEWGKPSGSSPLPKLEIGASYWMKGYETGGFIGTPCEVFDTEPPTQTCSPSFHVVFTVVSAKKTEPIRFGPGDFRDRRALLSGRAENREGIAYMTSDGWSVLVTKDRPWPADIDSKLIEAEGLYEPTDTKTEFRLADGTWRLVELEDQVGRNVELRGVAWSMNSRWWFRYRDTDIDVDEIQNLPRWSGDNHGRPMVIRGRLKRVNSQPIGEATVTDEEEIRSSFIVSEATWTPLSQLLSPERPYPTLGQQDQASHDRHPVFHRNRR